MRAATRAGRVSFAARVTAERKKPGPPPPSKKEEEGKALSTLADNVRVCFSDSVTQRVAVRKASKRARQHCSRHEAKKVRFAAPGKKCGRADNRHPPRTQHVPEEVPAASLPAKKSGSARLACCQKSQRSAHAPLPEEEDAAFDRTSTSRLSNECTRLLAQACDTSAPTKSRKKDRGGASG